MITAAARRSRASVRWCGRSCGRGSRPSAAAFTAAVPLVDQVAEHIIGGGGKRLRPLLVVLAGRACSRSEPALHPGRGVHRIHPYRHPAARRRGRHVGAAARARHRQRDLRQSGQRAGGGFRLFARVPAHGRHALAARHRDHGRCDQRDRRGRSAAADERARPRHHRGALSRGHPAQDRAAVPGRRRGRRRGQRRQQPWCSARSPTMAGISGPPTS